MLLEYIIITIFVLVAQFIGKRLIINNTSYNTSGYFSYFCSCFSYHRLATNYPFARDIPSSDFVKNRSDCIGPSVLLFVRIVLLINCYAAIAFDRSYFPLKDQSVFHSSSVQLADSRRIWHYGIVDQTGIRCNPVGIRCEKSSYE